LTVWHRNMKIHSSDMTKSIALALLLAFTNMYCSSESSGKADHGDPKPRRVKVVKAIEGNLPLSVGVSGTLAADEEVTLSLKVNGRIRTVFVDLGSVVRRGQPLLELEQTDFQLRVRQAEAAYQQARVRLGLDANGDESGSKIDPEETGVVRQAKATLEEARLTRERNQALFKEGLVARSVLDDAEAAFQVADARYQDALEEVRNRQGLLFQRRAELDLAHKQLSDSTLTAPMDGAIQERFVAPGQFAASGDKVFTLVRSDPLRLKLPVPERDAPNIRIGQDVQIHLEGDSQIYHGKIARVSPAISSQNRTLMVEAEVPNPDGALRAGSFARAEITVKTNTSITLVPATAIVTFAGVNKVISVEKNQSVEKRVKTGRRSQDLVEILDGLSPGEPVVISPGNLVGGQTVTVVW
jgi:RND family efflux transporter MFP subunit